jgi:hypothetical protein
MVGAVVTVAVAWAWAYLDIGARYEQKTGWDVYWLWKAPGYPTPTKRVDFLAWGLNVTTVSDDRQEGRSTIRSHSTSRLDAGWPLRSLRAESWEPQDNPPAPPKAGFTFLSLREGVTLATQPGAMVWIPLKPIEFGFAVDAVFYAVILNAAIWLVPGSVRAMRRTRGRCDGCGYDLAGVPSGMCPECGTATDQ